MSRTHREDPVHLFRNPTNKRSKVQREMITTDPDLKGLPIGAINRIKGKYIVDNYDDLDVASRREIYRRRES